MGLDRIVLNSRKDRGLDTESSMKDRFETNGFREYVRRMKYVAAFLGLGALSGGCDIFKPNQPPEVDFSVYNTAGIEQTIPFTAQVGDTLRFAGEAKDRDGTVQALEWYVEKDSQTDLFGDSLEVLHVFTEAGEYAIKFRARDNDGDYGSKTKHGTIVERPDQGPPQSTLNPYTGAPNDNTPSFSGTSVDSESSIVEISYRANGGGWTPVDSFTPSATVDYTFTTQPLPDGTQLIEVRAIDSEGNEEQSPYDSQNVTIDTIAPGIISLICREGNNPGETISEWYSTHEDGNEGGPALEYIIARSENPITNWSEFDAAEKVSGAPIPNIPGTQETFIDTGLELGKIYHYAIAAVDDAGNRSLSNSAVARAKPRNIEGVITNCHTQEPISGVMVYSLIDSSLTDASGHYSVPALGNAVHLAVIKYGYLESGVIIPAGIENVIQDWGIAKDDADTGIDRAFFRDYMLKNRGNNVPDGLFVAMTAASAPDTIYVGGDITRESDGAKLSYGWLNVEQLNAIAEVLNVDANDYLDGAIGANTVIAIADSTFADETDNFAYSNMVVVPQSLFPRNQSNKATVVSRLDGAGGNVTYYENNGFRIDGVAIILYKYLNTAELINSIGNTETYSGLSGGITSNTGFLSIIDEAGGMPSDGNPSPHDIRAYILLQDRVGRGEWRYPDVPKEFNNPFIIQIIPYIGGR